MPKIARAHHFVPEFFLAGFTPDETKEDLLWVTDFARAKQWKTVPKNAAHRRDFNRPEGQTLPPDMLEGLLGTI